MGDQVIEAICESDFAAQVQAKNRAEQELKRWKQIQEEAERGRRKIEDGRTTRCREPEPTALKAYEAASEPIIPKIGFHDLYGVWFFGDLTTIVRQISIERFGVDLEKRMNVYVNVEPNSITEGIHPITVYGHVCRLYKWKAQGFHRGLVVLIDDIPANQAAEIYLGSKTWSWRI